MNIDTWLRAIEQRILQIHTACSAMGDEQSMAPILSEWVKPKTKKLMATVPEIHEALLAQAAQQKKGGTDLEEDDDEEAERVKAHSQKSPFVPIKVNKAKERQQIIDWARKRQGHARTAAAVEVSKIDQHSRRAVTSGSLGGGSANAALKTSVSAPVVGRKPAGAAGSQLPPLGAGGTTTDSPQATAEGAAWYTAQHGAAPPQHRARADPAGTKHVPGHRARTPPDMGSASTEPALYGVHDDVPGELPRIPSADARNAPSRKGKGKGGSQGSMPGLHSSCSAGSSSAAGAPPKDLGTMIYLLGTQSSSMNARRLAQAAGPSH